MEMKTFGGVALALARHHKTAFTIFGTLAMSAHLLGKGQGADASMKQSHSSQAQPETETARLTFLLGSPRRYAARFLPKDRKLQIRVLPARANEFDASAYYDGRFVHRAVVKETNGEVVLSLQLKNKDVDWLVTHQESPWRIIVDLWANKESAVASQRSNWHWNGYHSSIPGEGTPKSTFSTLDPDSLENSEELGFEDFESLGESIRYEDELSQLSTEPFTTEDGAPTNTSAKSQGSSPYERFLVVNSNLPALGEEAAPQALGRNQFSRGLHTEALNTFRKQATLHRREFVSNSENLWLAGESALLAGRKALAKDYFLTLQKTSPKSSHGSLGQLRMLDINAEEGTVPAEKLTQGYEALTQSPTSSPEARSMAALRLVSLGSAREQEKKTNASLLPHFEECVKLKSLRQKFVNECDYQIFVHNHKTDDLVVAQRSIAAFEDKWPEDNRMARHKEALRTKVRAFLDDVSKNGRFAAWIAFERASDPAWIQFSNGQSKYLKTRAEAWEKAGNTARALDLYERAAEREADPKNQMKLLAKAANIAMKTDGENRALRSLRQVESNPVRRTEGLGVEATALVREVALAPHNQELATKMLLDEIFLGFHAENDLRTLVSLTERLKGSREADVLYEKILALPTRSRSEAELKEDTLLDFAEMLRNQGRLVKSADMFLSVANLDSGKSRAEAAYKAGVVYFRAGLLEKATQSWNIAANDLANSKYSALAKERLNRIR